MADRLRRAGGVLALTLLAASFQADAQEQPVAAVWKAREVDFFYRSSTAIFSCDALQDRVTAILRGIGARDDVQVRVDDCSNSFIPPDPSPNARDTMNPSNSWETPSSRFSTRPTGREQVTHVRVRLMFPTEVTPQILAELDRDKSRRELVSRVTGNPAAALNDPIVFAAKRQTVTLSRQTIGLDPAECELLDQISTSVFRELGVRVVRRSSSCSRNGVSRIAPKVTVESLIGIPFGSSEAQQTPVPGEGEADASAPAASGAAPTEPAPGAMPK